ncbi:hypothetical protein GCM10009677_06790 [Sphaerisporangium rubeum]|uniref:Uncharacterized protein n=1 Tax=Sphaerisporangium rubeum TaxID=321317 RepID=A0A7X0ILF2_9ACTN|nr:hypothetical protein [Sphaerisporangium rubeum]MBB6476889.1 hypothetical protein [Sphaerisporangium rubeum]
MVTLIGFVIVAIVLPLMVNETSELAPFLARKILVWAAKKHAQTSDELECYKDEWLDNLEQAPGKLTKLGHAICVVLLTVFPAWYLRQWTRTWRIMARIAVYIEQTTYVEWQIPGAAAFVKMVSVLVAVAAVLAIGNVVLQSNLGQGPGSREASPRPYVSVPSHGYPDYTIQAAKAVKDKTGKIIRIVVDLVVKAPALEPVWLVTSNARKQIPEVRGKYRLTMKPGKSYFMVGGRPVQEGTLSHGILPKGNRFVYKYMPGLCLKKI